jgi:hypothetical protein
MFSVFSLVVRLYFVSFKLSGCILLVFSDLFVLFCMFSSNCNLVVLFVFQMVIS